jgi:hypothetical protein
MIREAIELHIQGMRQDGEEVPPHLRLYLSRSPRETEHRGKERASGAQFVRKPSHTSGGNRRSRASGKRAAASPADSRFCTSISRKLNYAYNVCVDDVCLNYEIGNSS